MNNRPPSTEVLDRIHALMHAQGRHMQSAGSAEGHGLGPMEVRCLRHIAHHEGATQSDLVVQSGRDKAQIARLVKGLIERGLVTSQPHPVDRRSQVLSATTEGLALQREMQAHRAGFEAQLLAGFSASETASLLKLLKRLQGNASST
jgi:DNA-binding MarR family transcriptional regulator